MWPFKKSPERAEKEKKELEDLAAANKVSQALDLYESLCSTYVKFVGYYLAKCDTAEKLISTWEFFANGLYYEDILNLMGAVADSDALEIILASAKTRKYVIEMADAPVPGEVAKERYYLNMKPLVEIFMGLLANSDGLNVLCDYLEESGYVNEDGAALYDFRKDGMSRMINSCSSLYDRVEYDPETRSAKAGT